MSLYKQIRGPQQRLTYVFDTLVKALDESEDRKRVGFLSSPIEDRETRPTA